MTAERRNDPVANVLDRVEQHARNTRRALVAAAMIEGLFLVLGLSIIDWNNRVHILILVFSILTYSVLGLGLVALGAHVSRVGARVVAALDERG